MYANKLFLDWTQSGRELFIKVVKIFIDPWAVWKSITFKKKTTVRKGELMIKIIIEGTH